MRSAETFSVSVNYCSLSEQEEHVPINMFYNTIGAPCRKMEKDGRCVRIGVNLMKKGTRGNASENKFGFNNSRF